MTGPTLPSPPAQPGEPDVVARRVLFVAGAGRSGTSTLAGLMQILGLHVPKPEVVADETNPKGFGEPAWAVAHHDRLLKEALVQVSDSRPDAWFETGRICTREPERITTAAWLEEHFAVHPELVVKDPRLSWFLPLWRVAAIRTGATASFATMLRPPAEVVGSKQTYYANKLGSAHLAASWLNMLLHTERGTRDAPRVFVRYADLLDDWTRTTMAVGERLELSGVLHANSEQIRDGHRFVDPSLRRMTQSLADLGLPPRLHDLVGATWEQLDALAEPDGDTAAAHAVLDDLREAYVDLYSEAEAISRSSVVAAEQATRRQGRPGPGPGTPSASAPAPTSGASVGASVGADRVPHAVRAMVPASVRRGLRKAAGRERP